MRQPSARWIGYLLVAAVLLSGCGPNWQPVSVTRPRTFDERTVLEFLANDQLIRLHAVKIERDSLSGIPWLEHLTCDTCRVRYALADLSQARTGNPGATAWNILLPVMVIVGGLMLLASMIPYS